MARQRGPVRSTSPASGATTRSIPPAHSAAAGQRGCVETLLSGPALEAAYRDAGGRPRRRRRARSRSAADAGDAIAARVRDAWLDHFGRAIANLIAILDLSVVVLGGGLSNLDVLYDRGRDAVARRIFNDELTTPIVKHQLGDPPGSSVRRCWSRQAHHGWATCTSVTSSLVDRARLTWRSAWSIHLTMANLPGWVVGNREAVAREAAPYRGLSTEARFRLLSACRTAAHQLANRPDRERILDGADPLPPSSRAILKRLRDQDRSQR